MKRRSVLTTLPLGVLGLSGFATLANAGQRDDRMPVLFVGHGSPMNAIEDNPWSRAWAEVGTTLPRPNAIVCVSAHWQTRGVMVTAMARPETIHDFSDSQTRC